MNVRPLRGHRWWVILCAAGLLADCGPRGEPAAHETASADTAYLIATFRTEAHARLDHLARRLARLSAAADGRTGVSSRVTQAEARRSDIARQLEAFRPDPASFGRAADGLDAALDTLQREIDALVGRVAGSGGGHAPR